MSEMVSKWLSSLSDEDLAFIKRFVLASGSLKAIANEYDVSYPTVRARLDRIIAKIQVVDDTKTMDVFHRQVQLLLADGALPPSSARTLLAAHESVLETMKGSVHGNANA